jgi:hypothetical protein
MRRAPPSRGKRTRATASVHAATRSHLAAARPLLVRLRPTSLVALRCPDTHLDALSGLTALQSLNLSTGRWLGLKLTSDVFPTTSPRTIFLYGPPDAYLEILHLSVRPDLFAQWSIFDMHHWSEARTLRGLPVLNDPQLYNTGLQNVDALRELASLHGLTLNGCHGLRNVDGLRNHPALQTLLLQDCTGLKSVEALHGLTGLTGLKRLNLEGCTGLPASALRELRAALPQTLITFPDGGSNPPPE